MHTFRPVSRAFPCLPSLTHRSIFRIGHHLRYVTASITQHTVLVRRTTLRPVSWPWSPLSLHLVRPVSCHCEPIYLRRPIWWHPTPTSSSKRVFFLRYFLPEFVSGFCYRTNFLHARTTIVFRHVYTLCTALHCTVRRTDMSSAF